MNENSKESKESNESPDSKIVDGKTIPQMSMTRTMTLSKRPWALIVVFAVSLLFVIIFSLIHAFSKYLTPQGTVEKLITAFKNGDVETLLSDPELDFRERALSDIEKRGLEEYNKVDSAFEACLEEGLKKYKALRSQIFARGEEAFKSLSADDQRYIRSLSKMLWIYGEGMKSVGPEKLLGEKDPYVFIDKEKSEAFTVKLGKKAIEDGKKQAEAGAKPDKKKKTAKPPPKGAGQAGKIAFEELKKTVYAAGSKAFLSLPREEREKIEGKSKNDFLIEEGKKSLSGEDRELISGPEMFDKDIDEKQQASRLCLPFISKTQKELIKGKKYSDFITKKDIYIMRTGREKYEKFLIALFTGCSYEIINTKIFGKDAFDLIGVSKTSIEIKWDECTGVETFIPSKFLLELHEGKWGIIMGEPEEVPIDTTAIFSKEPGEEAEETVEEAEEEKEEKK